MRKLFFILTVFVMFAFASCGENGADNITPDDNNTEQPGDGNGDTTIPDDAYISLNKEIVTFSPDGERLDVKVYSNYAWTLTSNCDWCVPSITSGDASEMGTTITLTADLTYDDREGTIMFSCGNAKKVLIVSQSFKETIIADENNTFNVPAEGGNVIIAYQTTVECEVVIPEYAKSWISPAPQTRALVSASATLNIAENTTYGERSAVVKVVKVGDNTIFAEYTITQKQNDAIIANGDNEFSLYGWEQSVNIAYKTNVECEVIIPAEVNSWISLAPQTRALASMSQTLDIAENNADEERSATVKVVAVANSEVVAEYTITQKPRYCLEYTSTHGSVITLHRNDVFGATIVRNTYVNGKGYIDFDAPITSIGDAFSGCSSLTSVTIPDSVTSIGDSAFYECLSLPSITIPDSVTSIGSGAFYGCSSLSSITIGNGLTSIGGAAFGEIVYVFDDEGKIAYQYGIGACSLTSVHISDISAWCKINFSRSNSNPLWWGADLYLNGELVKDLVIPDSVTSIGNDAFNGYCSLTSVTIPDNIPSIGEGAFAGCSSLTAFYGKYASSDNRCIIKDGVLYAFLPAGLTSYTIPDSVTSIGRGAFYGCSSLTSVTIPDSVTSIEERAFVGCAGELVLNNKKFVEADYSSPDNVMNTWFDNSQFTSIVIGENVTSIGAGAFRSCTGLTSVTIPNSVTSIGERAFSGCSSLPSVTIGNNVTSIGGYAFYGCSSLTSVTIPDSVTSIGVRAFTYCSSLTSVTIGNSVTSIESNAFADSSSLTSVYISDLLAWCKIDFYNIGASPLCNGAKLYLNGSELTDITIPSDITEIKKYAFRVCTSLTSVTIPNSVTSIGQSAFNDCTGLTSVYISDLLAWCKIDFYNAAANPLYNGAKLYLNGSELTDITIPSDITEIKSYAFCDCTSLTSVTIPNSVTSIGKSAFGNCSSLTSVTIPNSVTSIGGSAFNNCSSLATVYCKSTTPPKGGSSMFSNNASERKIYVPIASVEAYKAVDYWSNYVNFIEGYNF